MQEHGGRCRIIGVDAGSLGYMQEHWVRYINSHVQLEGTIYTIKNFLQPLIIISIMYIRIFIIYSNV